MKIVASDLSNIEGRGLAWLAGEEWKLQAFRDYDAGTGADLYCITATSIIGGDPWKVEKKDRNVFGKVPDLACGYEGGAGAFETFEKAYGVDLLPYWPTIKQVADERLVRWAIGNYDKWGKEKAGPDVPRELWLARETCKLAWRARHPKTVALWKEAKEAAMAAIRAPGSAFTAGPRLKFCVKEHNGEPWLLCRLPSGKFLTYYRPRIGDSGSLSYEGLGTENEGSTARIWTRVYTYGGKLIENATQALARDILVANMPAIEAAGYQIVLTVHDEVVTEAPDDFTAARLAQIMSTVPEWAKGLPLAAAGFEADRYKKD